MSTTARLADPRSGLILLVLGMISVYAALPIAAGTLILSNPYFFDLAAQAIGACLMISLGYKYAPKWAFDNKNRKKFNINSNLLNSAIWLLFAAFSVITFVTADAIPLLSSFAGADSGELSMQRGEFFKTRTGAEAVLIYINTLFTSAVLPYSISSLYLQRHPGRHLALIVFLIYSISFLQKALFLNALLPVICILLFQGKRDAILKVAALIGIAIAILYAVTLLAFGGQSEINPIADQGDNDEYFTATYLPQTSIEHLVWRSTAVPMFSASDTLAVHAEQFGGENLYGATSSLLAGLTGREKVPMERLVAEYQWGWSDIANTNSVFFIEGYINFGWLGIIFFAFFAGVCFRILQECRDQAFQALWPIFAFGIFTSGIIGTMLSNGYALVFTAALLTQIGLRTNTTTSPKTNAARYSE